MALRQMKYMGCVAAVLAGGLGAGAPCDGGRHVVRPGDSIQRAVDRARPGDTVVVKPGVYQESVLINKSRLRLVGAGGKTVIKPTGKRADNACGQEGNGICVIGSKGHPLHDVHIRSLTVADFKRNGIWASGTERLTVSDVTSRKNRVWGIATEKSTASLIRDNEVVGNGDSGIFVANTVKEEGGATDTRGTSISQNLMADNRIGVTIRRVRNLTVSHNTMTGNCGGAFIVGDESRPRAGALTVRNNEITKNNKYCPANPRLPFLQGSGVVLTGTEDAKVVHNRIRDNAGKSPLSGGVVLFHSFVKALNERNVIADNVVLDNKPVDLANRDTEGRGNEFHGNKCRTSEPARLC
ncbi:nitrous oxide reductase family maturation protein NosD [Streptomyces sp. NPDC058989]|uniref:right-handed parallel beta-helix repeat-containing protein n=1 Tax=Streptomyces sp. NPDC058989 TaxID=3346686 RepID=UPI0036D0A26B